MPYAYYCNLTEYPSLATADSLSSAASTLMNLLRVSSYTHVSHIDPVTGAFHTDCSCLVSYLLKSSGLSAHLEDVPRETNDPAVAPPMPRAKEYANFIAGLSKSGTPRWNAIDDIWRLQHGDLVAWEIPNWKETNRSTGHVVVVVEPPSTSPFNATLIPVDSTSVWVSVLDASSVKHQWDSRCYILPCRGGVGHGYIRLFGDAAGRPIAFQFHDEALVRHYSISIARTSPERPEHPEESPLHLQRGNYARVHIPYQLQHINTNRW
ncbi:hypothetical protein PhCBS80983_g03381 [Powellomyces hirtus]|uniref:Uncharacterized protein n=1 Tax=Powellomyces hirtus TaxID=109895 RepID=A0A507E2U0_9FUNG|nr:hypothetical protein PhCBS80983_g03381 [Powellomyces hirtus]